VLRHLRCGLREAAAAAARWWLFWRLGISRGHEFGLRDGFRAQ
jgi:hypothetical protein